MNTDPHTEIHMNTHICYHARVLSLSVEFAACIREKRQIVCVCVCMCAVSVCAVERDSQRFPGNDWAEVSRLNE